MKRLHSQCPEVTHQVICQLHKMLKAGEEVTDEKWNLAYQLVRAIAMADTLEWKYEHLTKVAWQ